MATAEGPGAMAAAMGIVGDVRAVIQDLVTPDLKWTVTKLEAVDKKLDAAISQVDERLKAQDAIAAARHAELVAKLETFDAKNAARYDDIKTSQGFEERQREVEKRQKASSSHRKAE
jgi:hypothetical protein